MRQRKCPECGEKFQPTRQMQPCCDKEDCRVSYAIRHIEATRKRRKMRAQKDERIAAAEDRKTIKIRKEAIKTRPKLVAELGVEFRAWVRARDEGKPCISCDKPLIKTGKIGGDYDAGHYRSVGSAKHLEFDERNVHGQCKYCNDQLKSNPQGYRPRLIDRIGIDAVLALESDHEPRKYSKDDLREMKAHYIAKRKALIKDINHE